jgi:hypothetical protein
VNNDILTYSQQTNQIVSWPYPTGRYLPRFQQINDLARNLDLRYATFDSTRKHHWDEYWDPYIQKWICFKVDENGDPVYPSIKGLSAFRATNLNRFDQKLPFIDDPPTDPIIGNAWTFTHAVLTDTTHVPQNLYCGIIFHATVAYLAPLTTLSCSMWSRTTNTPTNIAHVDRKLKYLTTFYFPNTASVLLAGRLALRPTYYHGCYVSISLQFSYPGCITRYGTQFSIHNVAV